MLTSKLLVESEILKHNKLKLHSVTKSVYAAAAQQIANRDEPRMNHARLYLQSRDRSQAHALPLTKLASII